MSISSLGWCRDVDKPDFGCVMNVVTIFPHVNGPLPLDLPILLCWHHDKARGAGRRETQGQPQPRQCGPRPGQMQIFDCGDIFDDGHRVWTECTGPRRNANSRMIQWYNAPCHLITCPFSRTGPSPRTWLAIHQLELRCLGLAHWDQKRRRRITVPLCLLKLSFLCFCFV